MPKRRDHRRAALRRDPQRKGEDAQRSRLSTQPITTIIAPAIASKNRVSSSRGSCAKRAVASANSVMNRITGNTASRAAASTTLAGISEPRKSATPGTWPAAFSSAPLSAATAPAGIGNSRSSMGVSSADSAAPASSTKANRPSVRRAIAPAEAAAMVRIIPMKISAETSGRMVIWSARNQSAPIGSATATSLPSAVLPCRAMPSAKPPARPANAQTAGTSISGSAAASLPSAMHSSHRVRHLPA